MGGGRLARVEGTSLVRLQSAYVCRHFELPQQELFRVLRVDQDELYGPGGFLAVPLLLT